MTPAEPIDTVVFDVGRVLLDWDPRYLFRKLFPGDEAAVERFLSEVCPPAWNQEQDLGRSWAEGVRERVARFPEQRAAIEAFDARWGETVAGEIAGTVALQRRLRQAGVRLYALTNFSREKWAWSVERFACLRDFDGVLVSAHEGLLKPDARFYRLLTTRFGVRPARSVFVDDVPGNVDAAASVGFHGVRFTTPEALEADLRRLGLLRG